MTQRADGEARARWLSLARKRRFAKTANALDPLRTQPSLEFRFFVNIKRYFVTSSTTMW
jgi:hypothetical protein